MPIYTVDSTSAEEFVRIPLFSGLAVVAGGLATIVRVGVSVSMVCPTIWSFAQPQSLMDKLQEHCRSSVPDVKAFGDSTGGGSFRDQNKFGAGVPRSHKRTPIFGSTR